jgi:hypothetical protein
MCIPLSLLGNGSVKSSLRQRIYMQQYNNSWACYFLCGLYRIKISRRLVLPRTSCTFLVFFQSIHKKYYLLLVLTHYFNSSANYLRIFSIERKAGDLGTFVITPSFGKRNVIVNLQDMGTALRMLLFIL